MMMVMVVMPTMCICRCGYVENGDNVGCDGGLTVVSKHVHAWWCVSELMLLVVNVMVPMIDVTIMMDV